MPEPQVSFAIVARDAAGKVLADVQLDLERVADRARKAGGGMGSLGTAAEHGSTGVRKMENAIQNLASRAAGIEGPVGKLLEGVLAFGVGGTAVVGFAAGFLAMREAMEFFGRDAREAEARLLAMREAAEKLRRTPLMDASALRIGAQTDLNAAQNNLSRLERGDFTMGELASSGVGGKSLSQLTADARTLVKELQDHLATFTDDVKKVDAEANEKLGNALQDLVGGLVKAADNALATLEKEMRGRIGLRVHNLGLISREFSKRTLAGEDEGRPGFLTQQIPRPTRSPLTISPTDLNRFSGIKIQTDAEMFERRNQALEEGAKSFDQAAAITVAAFGAMAQAAIAGSDQMASAFIGGMTQIIQAATAKSNPILGAVIGAVGGIVSGLLGRSNRPAPVKIDEVSPRAAHDIASAAAQIPPQPVVVFNGREGAEQAANRLQQQTQRDRSPRVPRGVVPALLGG